MFFNKKTELYLKNEIEIIDAKSQETNKNILEYFKDISKYLKEKDDEQKTENKDLKVTKTKNKKTFLEQQYEKLTVAEESVLHSYLNQLSLKDNQNDFSNLIFPFSFNKSQKEAIKTVLEKNIGIIEGPPGTGKTQTILNLLANLAIMQNKTVAVVSNNNEATKNVYEKMSKYGYSFMLGNLGRKSKRQKFFKNMPKIKIAGFNSQENIQNLLEENEKLNQRLDYFLEKLKRKAVIEKQISDYTLEQKYFEKSLEQENISDIKIDIELDEKKIFKILYDLQFLKEKAIFLKPIYIFICIYKYKLKHLQKNSIKYILKLQKEFYDLKLKNLNSEKTSIEEELLKANYEEIQNRQKEISDKIFKHKIYEKYQNIKQDFNFEDYISKFEKFIEAFPIILSTTYSLRMSVPSDFLFDYVIIDESSQVDLVAGSLALSVAKNAIIVGDEKQLPQIVDLKIKKSLFNSNVEAKYDYFNNNILSSIRAVFTDSIPTKTLTEHYRCHPKIIEFSNKRYYNNELIAYPNEEHKKVEKPLILYYTAPGSHMSKVTEGINKGTYNQRELDVIKEEVLKKVHIDNYNDEDIGITTPYRLQADLMAKDEETIESDTIHKYQGREKNVMILSTVIDNTIQGRNNLFFVDNANMLNVAVSRAINKFILVTDNQLFKEHGEEVNSLLKYIQYQSMSSEILESKLVSVFDLLYKDYSQTLNSLNKRLLNRTKFKSENIIDTILFNEFKKEEYKNFLYTRQVFLKNQFKDLSIFNKIEQKFINSASSFDFVIYDKMNLQPIMIIEVDGFKFHENNPIQLKRDKIKNEICKKAKIPLERLKTNKTYSEDDIIKLVKGVLLK